MRIGNVNGHAGTEVSMIHHQQIRHTATKNKTGMSTASMQAMISADISMSQAKTQGAVRMEMKGKANVLRSEIEQDGNLGGDTQKKEEALTAMEDRIQRLESTQMNSLSDIQKDLQEAAKVEAEEKRAVEKAENSEKANNRDGEKTQKGGQTENTIFDPKPEELSANDVPPGSNVNVVL